MNNYSAFSYINGNSFLHKCPAWCKILFIPFINICFLFLPVYFCFCLIIIQFITAFCLKFSLKQQFADLKPVIYYGFLLFAMDFFLCIFSKEFDFASHFTFKNTSGQGSLSLKALTQPFLGFITNPKSKRNCFLLAKLFCMMQSASLFFKTSTSLELRNGIELIEYRIRKIFHLKEKTVFTNTVYMFLNFIPQISQIWAKTKCAWIARGGKKSVKMYAVLLPVLFSVGMKKAYNTARAVEIRNG